MVDSMMKYVVWGAGYRGSVIAEILGDKVVAFIDGDKNKIGTTFWEKPVISYEQYKEKYQEYVILIGVAFNEWVAEQLDEDGMFYFCIEDCAPEYMGYGWRRAQKVMKNLVLEIPSNVAIYGMSLYSVIVYEELMKRGYKNVALIPHRDMPETMIAKFKEYFPTIPIKPLTDINVDAILLTIYEKGIKEWKLNAPIIDIYDWTQYVHEYKNEKIAQMKNTHKGERCFIVATGPSLRKEDLEKLHENKEFCISMNGVFGSFGEFQWRPDIWVCVDASAIKMWEDSIMDIDVKDIFVSDAAMNVDYSRFEQRCHIFHSIFGREVFTEGVFTEDFSTKVLHGSSVTNVCIQLAVYLGFEEIYLLGVDNSYLKKGKQHFNNENEERIKETKVVSKYKRQELGDILVKHNQIIYTNSKLYAENHSIKIYNATRGGELEVFERVDFDSLFKEIME